MINSVTYKTAAGSVVTISGKHGGIIDVDFDWLEEGGCIDCFPALDPREIDYLYWHCDFCGGGKAKLIEAYALQGDKS